MNFFVFFHILIESSNFSLKKKKKLSSINFFSNYIPFVSFCFIFLFNF